MNDTQQSEKRNYQTFETTFTTIGMAVIMLYCNFFTP